MSISLSVKDYCQSCREFEAETTVDTICAGPEINETIIVVTCSHKDRCAEIEKFIKREMKSDMRPSRD